MNETSDVEAQVVVCDLNSITNIGDFIQKKAGIFEVFEVKKGKKARGSRLNQQIQRLEELTRFINEGKGQLHGRIVELVRRPPRTHKIESLSLGFDKSVETGYFVGQINPYQSIACFDLRNVPSSEHNAILDAAIEQTSSIWKNERTIEISSFKSRQWTGIVPPFTVVPLDTELIVVILMGRRLYVSTISLDALVAYIESMGWLVLDLTAEEFVDKVAKDDFDIFMLFRPNDIERNINLPLDILLWVAVSLIEVESFLDFAEQQVNKEKKKAHWIPDFSGEHNIWT